MTRTPHIPILLGLMLLSCLIQTATIRRARVTALDAVRFARAAEAIDRVGAIDALRTEQQPLFPVWVWGVHRGLLHTVGPTDSHWATSVQLAAAIPLVLAIWPVYFLILRLTNRSAAIAGSLFFCVLPEIARLGADGLSDSLHLLFFCLAFWAMVEILASQTIGRREMKWSALAGMAAGLAVLTRVEVLVLVAAFLPVWAIAHRRETWARLTTGCGCFAMGLIIVVGPYLVAMGATTPRQAATRVLGRQPPDEEPSGHQATWLLPDGRPMAFDVKESSVSSRQRGYAKAIVQFGRKLADAFGYWIGALALFGAWQLGRKPARPVDRFVQVFFVLHTAIAIHFAATEGYLAARHLLGLVVAGLPAAGFGALELGRLLRRPRIRWAVALLAAVACLPMTLIHVHDSRRGHRDAAAWLAAEGRASGGVLDSRGWAGLYSGRDTYLYDRAQVAFADPQLAYLVLEQQELNFDSRRARTLKALLRVAAEPVGEFPDATDRKPNQQPVVVYRWHPDQLKRFLEKK